jgi:hypothetical protein
MIHIMFFHDLDFCTKDVISIHLLHGKQLIVNVNKIILIKSIMNSYKQNLKKGSPKKIRFAHELEDEDEFMYPAKKTPLQVKFEKFKKRYTVKS